MKYKSKIGDLVEVEWIDAAGYCNEKLSNVKLSTTTNYGLLVKYSRKEVILQSGVYHDDDTGDYFIVPAGWIINMRTIRKAVN